MITANPRTRAPRPTGPVSVSDLAAHIERNHHASLRASLQRLERLIHRLDRSALQPRPQAARLRRSFPSFRDSIYGRLIAEARILFPMIRSLEAPDAARAGPRTAVALCAYELEAEHLRLLQELDELRRLVESLATGAEADDTARTANEAFALFAHDLRGHIHTTSRVLFPAAIGLERRVHRPETM